MVIALFVALDYEILNLVIYPSFEALEKREAIKDVDRCVSVLQREQQYLDTLCRDWASSEGMNNLAVEGDSGFAESGFTSSSFERNHLNAIYICDSNGNVSWNEVRGQTGEPIEVDGFSLCTLLDGMQFEQVKNVNDVKPRITMTSGGPMMVSAYPVHPGGGSGPGENILILGRFLDDNAVKMLAGQIHVDFELLPAGSVTRPEDDATVAALLSGGKSFAITEGGNDHINVYKVLDDIHGEPAFLLRADIPREILARGRSVVTFAQISVLAAAILILLVLLVLIQRTVINPITRLTGHVVEVGQSNDLSNSFGVDRDDEIGTLAGEFDGMVRQLDEARKKLMDQSYSAGKGEMISLVLHNVRNILNPIIGEIDIMRERLSKIPIEQMKTAKQELSEGHAPTERERDLKEFLNLGIDNLSSLAEDMTGKLGDLLTRSNEIVGLLNDYGNTGRFEKPVEKVKLGDILAESIKLLPKDLKQSVTVEVAPELDELDPLSIHRITAREVLTELLINAAEAIRRAEVEEGRIDIHANEEDIDGEAFVHLRIRDNGEGIEADRIESIFNRGHSSKGNGNRGNGLHWCANTLSSMRGSLRAESEGAGHGACMHILFPHDHEVYVTKEEE